MLKSCVNRVFLKIIDDKSACSPYVAMVTNV